MKLAGLFVAVVLVSSAAASAQSLTELAKKEKDRQAKARAAGSKTKVYTEIPGDPNASKPDGTEQTAEPTPVPPELIGTRPLKARPTERPSARAHRTVSVTIYVTSWCGYCRKAREFLARQPNVQVVAHDIEENLMRHREMLSKTGGAGGVPVIDVEGIILHGYSPESLSEAISTVRSR